MFDWFPKNISTYGADIDSVFYLIFYIVGIGFLLGEGAIIYFLFRYRKREGKKASFVRGESWAQVAWILVPAAIILVLDLWIDFEGAKAYDKIKGDVPVSDVTVQIKGKQFNWIITYPGPDGAFGTEDDLTQENDMHVPVNQVVKVVLTSQDVIHSFFVPVLRLKQDLVPGREIEAWFEATETGKYEIACAELCGYGHYTMRGFLYVHSDNEYRSWLESHWPVAESIPDWLE
ncbi:MAG: cytochrome c oxidase subunit II [bacterium]